MPGSAQRNSYEHRVGEGGKCSLLPPTTLYSPFNHYPLISNCLLICVFPKEVTELQSLK